MRDLVKLLRRPPGDFVVLSGMGGVGKSTVAITSAARGRALGIGRWRRVDVWWVSVADRSSLFDAMVVIAGRLGAPEHDLDAIGAGRPDAPDRVWARLDQARRRWLLVLDNADEPEVLARHPSSSGAVEELGRSSVGDGDGWLRPTRRGLVVVTSRDGARTTWGRHARIMPVDLLSEADAARVLLDSAPQAGTETEARCLALRLGRLPLALGLAASYLDSDVVLKASFPAYHHDLDSDPRASRLLAGTPASTDPRAVVTRTWELSLDALARRGVGQARSLLRLLSCYAASTPIPQGLLEPERLAPITVAKDPASPAAVERALESGLRHLRQLRLIEPRPIPSGHERALALHPLVADTNRAHLASGMTGDVDAALVRRVAADLIVGALDRLDEEEPTDWPQYRILTPHIHALFDVVARDLGEELLADLVRASTTAALAHDRSGAVAEGERLSRAAFPVLVILGDDHPVSLFARHIFAWEVTIQGRPTEAEVVYRDVLARRIRILGDAHPDTISSHHELAWVAAVQQRWAEAEALYHEVIASRVRVLGNDHHDTLVSRQELAWVIASQGRGDEAEAALRVIVDTRAQVSGPDHLRTLGARHDLAWAIAVQDRWNEAEHAYRDLLADRRRILGADHPATLSTWHELAWTIASQGRRRQAIADYEQALAARRRVLGADHPDTIDTDTALQRLRRGTTTPAQHVP